MSRWIGQAECTVDAVVPAPPADVRAFYVDLERLVRVHPLVVAVTTVAREGERREYRVVDRIPLGPVTLRTRYAVTMTVPDGAGEVVADSRQFPRVRLNTTVSFAARGDQTVLTEHMRITAPRPLLAVTVRQAVAAHTTMLERIAAHFSSGR
ncbi:SRPBCC family protein [Mycobacterium sp. ACS4331]|uniref:SRPBCC family protein n=1 Tax=Mycobacterium sp. ACS4331 TaxID=1834121 RepID=UPI0007FFC2B2|nr:SRPBCC family protein [Mycobacterium sp. ACS4331]OBF12922.1 hypothetical protein A5727_17610 [Mycobacterium sp. ACS4331]